MATTNINTLKSWFTRGAKPLQTQFAAWLDSFWHKDEEIPISAVKDLQSILNSLPTAESIDNDIAVIEAVADEALLTAQQANTNSTNATATATAAAATASDAALTANNAASVAATALRDNVPGEGDTLNKLYTLITTLQTLVNSDDTNLDTVQEIVAFIKNNKDVIDSISTNKVDVSKIVDNLLSTDATTVLSGNMGRELKALITALTTDAVAEGGANKYHTNERSITSVLTGFLAATSKQAIAATDSVLGAFGKVAYWLTWLDANKLDKILTLNKIWVGNSSNVPEELVVYDEFLNTEPSQVGQKFDAPNCLILKTTSSKLAVVEKIEQYPVGQIGRLGGVDAPQLIDLSVALSGYYLLPHECLMYCYLNSGYNGGDNITFSVGNNAPDYNNIVASVSIPLANFTGSGLIQRLTVATTSPYSLSSSNPIKLNITGKSTSAIHDFRVDMILKTGLIKIKTV